MEEPPEYGQCRPAPVLRRSVSRYTGYRITGPPGLHHGLPSGHLTLIVCLSGTLDVVAMPDRARPPVSSVSMVAGLHDAPAVISHDGRQYGVQLDLTWQGARTLFGVPAGELVGDVVDLAALLGRRAGELADRLAGAAGWRQRFDVLDHVLAGLADDRRAEPPAEVTRAWRRLAATGGRLPVGELARELGWSRRHLGERFRREVGLSPKTAARVIRFERACRRMRSAARPPLAEVAAECGYFDQAHLAREFRALAGTTATGWLAEFPSVQDQGGGPAPG
ncbi:MULTISPECIES: helix-turn-helix domain-containing protein [Streptosporangium]|uniref:AraC-like DNA-binding protein n=1 Tax=Streptosporangium brasiliense TaxID=47480 RepID=A0ABT9R6P9_9ACTN|nr:helix-turn-helix domain-containing protein [Streptosporangium brasiliense]MDP9864546.1 AraC-like DNA-binding protein [Streptosporangium brasiliense]